VAVELLNRISQLSPAIFYDQGAAKMSTENDHGGEDDERDHAHIELISDEDGILVLGKSSAVEAFIASTGLAVRSIPSRDITTALSYSSIAAKLGGELAENSGRWVKLTKESADLAKTFGLQSKKGGGTWAMIGKPGNVQKWLEVEKSVGAALTNPRILAGLGGLMAQLVMQQEMDEIKDKLEVIEAKLDAVIRSQTNQVLARVDGVSLALKEAMSVRASVGRVSDITWSKVQASVQTIHETLGFSVRQLADIADSLETADSIAKLLKTAEDAQANIETWLIVIARCVQLLDNVSVLELDRVMDESPEELEKHRMGLRSARLEQIEYIAEKTVYLFDRMDAAVSKANTRVLFNPLQSPAVVAATGQIAQSIIELRELLGIESGREEAEARRWKQAASDNWTAALETGADGVDVMKKLGSATKDQALSMKRIISDKRAEKKQRRGKDDV
jgi:hypothetical protein